MCVGCVAGVRQPPSGQSASDLQKEAWKKQVGEGQGPGWY